jgi:hypothetical protein
MRQNGKLNKDDAENWIYSRLTRKAYPKIVRYRKNQKGADKRETSQFTDAVTTLRNKSQRGFRWLALREKFGVGIMALYYHSVLFSETARISIDDDEVSEEEFNLLMTFLDSGPQRVAFSTLQADQCAYRTRGGRNVASIGSVIGEVGS